MKKSIFILVLVLLFTSGMSAQEEKPVFRQKGDLSLNVNGAMGILDLYAMTSRTAPYYLSVGGTMEYRVNNGIALGLGMELAASEAYNANVNLRNGKYALSMPVFASFKANFWNNCRVSPFVEMRLGYALPLMDLKVYKSYWSHEWNGSCIHQVNGGLRPKGLYLGGGIGLSTWRSEVTLGVNFTQYEINGIEYVWKPDYDGEIIDETDYHYKGDPMANVYVRYTYKFGLNRDLPKHSVNTEHNGDMDLLVYGQCGLLDPILFLDEMIKGHHYSASHYGFGTLLDYRVNRTMSIGMGLESYCSSGGWCQYMRANDRNAWLLPVYGNFRVRFGGRRVVPFGEVQLGYAFPLNTVTLLPNWDGQISRVTELEWHGQVQAKGIYTGIDLGIGFGHHEITLGHKCVSVSGDLTNIHSGDISHRSDNMVNIYLKYAYRIRLR